MINSSFDRTVLNKEVMHWLPGAPLAEKILKYCRQWIQEHQQRIGRGPVLGLIRVGDDPASIRYMQKKILACHAIGIESRLEVFNAQSPIDDLKMAIHTTSHSTEVDGVIVQLPLPQQLKNQTRELINAICVEKDVDGLTDLQQMKLHTEASDVLIPCTAAAVMALLHHYAIPLSGKNIVLIGRSILVGKPVATLLLKENASLTILHSYSREIEHYLRVADIVVVAIGKAHHINVHCVPSGAVIIDVGISVSKNGKLLGDVSTSALPQQIAMTPVPGGVGPVTVAMLMHNCCRAYALTHGLSFSSYP